MKPTENHERSDAAAIEAEAMAWLAEREEGFAPGRAGAMNMAGQLGSFLTTVLFGYLVNAFGSYNAPLVPIAFMSVIAALAWTRIDATRPLVPDGPTA